MPADSNIYYHGSMDKLSVGTILKPRTSYEQDWGETSFYQTLERYRPPEFLAHAEAVFMCDNEDDIDNAGGGTEWLFRVRPLGPIHRHDLNWSSAISAAVDEGADEITLRQLAENYWGGIPHPNESVWEYLTPAAEILEVCRYEYGFDACTVSPPVSSLT